MAIGDEGNVKWVDVSLLPLPLSISTPTLHLLVSDIYQGLRGVASALVVIKHIVSAWFEYLLWPSPSVEDGPVLLELPFIRVFIQGRIGVAVFCLVTGYVCALKPVRLILQGNHNHAYAAMSRSAVRRVPRLVLPVSLTIALSFVATQLGAFETANHCDGAGLPQTSPDRRDSLSAAFAALMADLVRVWTHGESEYGSELWTMMPILKGAFWVYVYLVATARVQQRWRMLIALGLTLVRWAANDAYFGMQFFFGAFLADLQNLDPDTFPMLQALSTRPLRIAISTFCLVVGLFIASLPQAHSEWLLWSRTLSSFLAAIMPRDPHLPRFSSGLGLDIIAVGLHLSTPARNVLSNRFFLFLGRMSFAVYLLHNQLLRSVLCWILYGFQIPEKESELLIFDSPWKLIMLLPVYLGMTYGAAYLWTNYVDSWCARLSERLVNSVKEDSGEKPSSSLPH